MWRSDRRPMSSADPASQQLSRLVEHRAAPSQCSRKPFRRKLRIADIVLLLIVGMLPLTGAVKCYCTEKTCEPYGYCEADWCVVGIRKSTGQVIRSCGTSEAALLRICRRDMGDWQDLCSCGEPLCNSYAFLRMQIRHNRISSAFVVAATEPHDDLPEYVQQNTDYAAPYHSTADPLPIDQPPPAGADVITFTRIDEHTGKKLSDTYGGGTGSRRPDAAPRYPPPEEGQLTKTSIIIIVLVAVPLVVGAAATIIVSFNYYCNLC